MHIYLDESGNFSGVGLGRPALSVQGALTLPSGRIAHIFEKYARLRPQLSQRNGEVKGSLLNERQVAAVIEILRRNEAIFAASVIDMGAHEEHHVTEHQRRGVAALAANLTDGHTPELRGGIADLQRRMAAFKAPLYAQSMVTLDLLRRVLQESITYHCQRNPKELSAFHWIIDGKAANNRVTDWEDWWSNTLVVWLQAMSIKRPVAFIPTGNYRFFERFFTTLPDYLRPYVAPDDPSRAGIDLQAVFRESFRFSSLAEPGLELVDIVTNASARALKGNLGEAGWLPLRGIMIHQREPYLRPVSLAFEDRMVTSPYSRVIRRFTEGGRIMITRAGWDRYERKESGSELLEDRIPKGFVSPRWYAWCTNERS